MAIARKILFSLFFISIFLFFISVATYISLIYKPENLIFLANKYFQDDLIIEYEKADSNKDLLSPGFNFKRILVKDFENKIILEADNIIDLGPAGGKKGGEIVYCGNVKNILNNKNSMTGLFLKKEIT